MWYWDGNGDWNITVYAEDNEGEATMNTTTHFQYNILYAIIISPPETTFNVTIGATNQTASLPIVINNTGNYNATGNITVNATNLHSGTNYLDAGNFTVDIDTGGAGCSDEGCLECDGTALENATEKTLSNSMLEKGNLSAGKSNESLYFCLTEVPTTLPSGTYNTQTIGSWTIRIITSIIFIYTPQLNRRKQIRSQF